MRPIVRPARSAARSPISARRRVLAAVLLGTALGTLTGCGPKRLRADFKNFEMAYADTSNHQVLLNLARLQNRDPTYFFKLGQITSQYRMNATLSGNGSYINSGTSAPGFGNVTGGGAPALLYENDPSFTFIPVDDGTNAQLVLKPVPPETFYDLFQQGWRMDQLFRLMVDRIEYVVPAGSGCQVVTLRNVPPPTLTGGANTSAQLSQYVTFLRVSALMYALQRHGYLLLKGDKSFVPVDPESYVPADAGSPMTAPAESGKKPDDGKAGAGPHTGGNGPAAKDMNDAAAKEQSWRLSADGKRWILGTTKVSAEFYLNPLKPGDPAKKEPAYVSDIAKIEAAILADPDLQELTVGPVVHNALLAIRNGFSIEGMPGVEAGDDCSGSPHIYLRSLLGLMAAASQEEGPFEALIHEHPLVPPSQGEPERKNMEFQELVPAVERIPTLRIQSAPGETEDAPLTTLFYDKKTYLIADVTSNTPAENLYWNRDVFRLINQLTSQVTVDISKFPLPTTLQLHQ